MQKEETTWKLDIRTVGGVLAGGAAWPSSHCAGTLALSGCTKNTDTSGPTTETTTAAKAAKVDDIANMVPEDIKSSGKLIVGVNVPYTPNEFKDPSGKIIGFDVDLMNAIASTLGLTRGVPRGRLRQDHPGDPGRHLQRRHVVVHRHQGTRAAGRLRHVLLGGLAVGQRPKGSDIDPDNACGKKVAVQATTTQEVDELPARSKTCTDAGKPAIEILKFDGQDQATNAVVLGQADAMSADSPVTLYAIKQSNGKLEQAGEVFDSAPYGWPVKKGSALAAALQKALEHLIEIG